MAYDAKPWLRKVAQASDAGMSEQEVIDHGFGIMLAAMRAAYDARHPRDSGSGPQGENSRSEVEGEAPQSGAGGNRPSASTSSPIPSPEDT